MRLEVASGAFFLRKKGFLAIRGLRKPPAYFLNCTELIR